VQPVGGLFTASGLVGGTATVRAEFTAGQTVSATATVQVQLQQTFAPAGAPGDLMTRFAGTQQTDAARQADVVYPLDGVVFPQNVAPADVQWLVGTTGDWFRVTLSKPDIVFTTYVQEDGNHHVLLDVTGWRAVAQTNPLSSATLDVVRWEASTQQLISTPQRLVRFAAASLVGSIYYWDIARGRIVRIDDGTTTRTEFMPTPPPSLAGNDSCVGCHAVSPSGRYMAGRLGGGDNIGGMFDLTTDLSAAPAPTLWPLSRTAPESPRWWFSSFSPDERRLVMTQNESASNQALNFMDPQTGQLVAFQNVPTDRATHPAWSPDGTRIAYVALSNGGEWGGQATQGDIKVVPVTAADTLGAATLVHAGSSLSGDVPAGDADSYPTWSTDSKWLAFSHGSSNRSEGGAAALYLMKADGNEVRRLTRASGGAMTADCFQPRFSPFKQGGYFWLSFLSRRDYGNAQVGTRGANRQQIWVAAISENPQPNVDPSEVAYWLPGQNTASQNIAAYWAPRPCRQAGASCTVGTECCSGDCRNSGGALVCSPPPPERCRRLNETCGGTGDCCPNQGLVCLQNVCVLDIQ
jgi:WD40 repeat protein